MGAASAQPGVADLQIPRHCLPIALRVRLQALKLSCFSCSGAYAGAAATAAKKSHGCVETVRGLDTRDACLWPSAPTAGDPALRSLCEHLNHVQAVLP